MRERELTVPSEEWTPTFKIITDHEGCSFAVFDSKAEAFEYDLLYPHVFRELMLDVCPCGCGAVAFALGRLH